MHIVESSAGARYAIDEPIGIGGMGVVYLAQRLGAGGFSRTVAIKRLHPQYLGDPEALAMFLEEARLAAQVRHPNVVAALDVFEVEGEPLLVMEYVRGASLFRLISAARARGQAVAPSVATAIAIGALEGLHAAHEARADDGAALGIVHRDVSPQNVLVGADGFARVADFGIARATDRLQSTRTEPLKGKLGYMAPERFQEGDVDRRVDLFSMATVLWESLTASRLFRAESALGVMNAVQGQPIPPPSARAPAVPHALDHVVLRGLARDPRERFATAREMAIALERALRPATERQVAEWVGRVACDILQTRDAMLARIDRASRACAPVSAIRCAAPATAFPDETTAIERGRRVGT